MEKDLTDSNEEEAELRKLMLKNCRKVVLLCYNTKFDKVSFCRICGFDRIDYLITDKNPSPQWIELLKEKGVKVICDL